MLWKTDMFVDPSSEDLVCGLSSIAAGQQDLLKESSVGLEET